LIQIGLTGWSDHPLISPDAKRRLEDYAGHFPVVEMDTSFYAIPPEKNILSWLEKTPDMFQFIPKAHATMTKHKNWFEEFNSIGEMFDTFNTRFNPMIARGKIKAFLFQFPPYFDCKRENIEYLRTVRKEMEGLPVAIEFRHPSWLNEKYKDQTLAFMKEMNFIHVVVDQPQTPHNSVPRTPIATNPSKTLFRLHGRNYAGWLGEHTENWRKVRTLHDYSDKELEEIKDLTEKLEKDSKEVTVIFNNNSGGHAAKNAKTLQNMLGIDFEGLGPRQLGLF